MSTTSPLPLQRCRSTSATESRRDSRTRDYPHAPLCVSGASSLLWRCAPILAMATSCLARSPLKNSAPYNPSGLSSTSNPCSLTGPATCPSSGNLECEMFRGDTTPSSPLGEPACGFVPQGNNTGMYQTGRAGLRRWTTIRAGLPSAISTEQWMSNVPERRRKDSEYRAMQTIAGGPVYTVLQKDLFPSTAF